jgi:hypothetical protein
MNGRRPGADPPFLRILLRKRRRLIAEQVMTAAAHAARFAACNVRTWSSIYARRLHLLLVVAVIIVTHAFTK